MVSCFNSRNTKDMDPQLREKIISLGIPIELYDIGYTTLGPVNKSSVTKFANMITQITKNELPFFQSRFTEMVVDRCTGKSKQDFREIIDSPPGSGKSYSALYGACRYAIEAADRFGQEPKDFFTIENNCALLQDTDGITHLMDNLDKHQAVVIDDAGVSIGHKDALSKSSKNVDAIMATCRTKRWYVIFTAPMNKHMDLTIRELVYCRGTVFKSCHEAGFNILQQKSIAYKHHYSKGRTEINPHYTFDDQRVELYAYFSPEMLDPYTNIIDKYDKARDTAADSLIHDKAKEERQRKNPVDKREQKFSDVWEKYKDTIFKLTHDEEGKWLDRKTVENRKGKTYSVGKIASETGLTDRTINKIIGKMKYEEK